VTISRSSLKAKALKKLLHLRLTAKEEPQMLMVIVTSKIT